MKWINKIKTWSNKRYGRKVAERYFKLIDKQIKKSVDRYFEITKDENRWLKDNSTLMELADEVFHFVEDMEDGIWYLNEGTPSFVLLCDYMTSEEYFCLVSIPESIRKYTLEFLKENIQSYYDSKKQALKIIQWGMMDVEEEEKENKENV